jgi:hypothetical protein
MELTEINVGASQAWDPGAIIDVGLTALARSVTGGRSGRAAST